MVLKFGLVYGALSLATSCTKPEPADSEIRAIHQTVGRGSKIAVPVKSGWCRDILRALGSLACRCNLIRKMDSLVVLNRNCVDSYCT